MSVPVAVSSRENSHTQIVDIRQDIPIMFEGTEHAITKWLDFLNVRCLISLLGVIVQLKAV